MKAALERPLLVLSWLSAAGIYAAIEARLEYFQHHSTTPSTGYGFIPELVFQIRPHPPLGLLRAALGRAIETRQMGGVERWLKYGADPNALQFNRTPLWLAVGRNAGIMRALLTHGADPNKPSGDQTPIHGAATLGDVMARDLLLSAGADVNARDERRNAPIIPALNFGRADAVRLLLNRGASLDVVTSSGETPRGFAVKRHGVNSELVRMMEQR